MFCRPIDVVMHRVSVYTQPKPVVCQCCCMMYAVESGSGKVGGCVPDSAGQDQRARGKDGGRER